MYKLGSVTIHSVAYETPLRAVSRTQRTRMRVADLGIHEFGLIQCLAKRSRASFGRFYISRRDRALQRYI